MKIIYITFLLVIISFYSVAQKDYKPTKENLEARQWFQDAKFGLFVHWGVYSILSDGEWVMQIKSISKKDYEKLPAFFNPIAFDAAEWVSMAKKAGMKYITITSKHHDGFAMYDSKVSDYNIVKSTPYGKDVLKLLAEECHKQGIKLFFYYSQLDWHHNDYYPRGGTGKATGRPEQGDWYKYLDYMDAQLTELLTNYGPIAGIWFDGWWDRKDADWRLEKTYKLIHDLQPQCLIGSNHHQAPMPGEDFQMFEKDLPGHNTSGFSPDAEIGNLPLETCETMNGSWGFNLKDNKYKSTKDLIHYLVKAAGYNSNFLLNVGPMPDGRIQPEFVKTLEEMGQWMDKNGETVYGTRGGPFQPAHWGVSTQKDKKIFLHILDLKEETLLLPNLKERIKQVYFYDDNSKVEFQNNTFGLAMKIPNSKKNELDTIVVVELS
jgi:alpha-L-fucosidase